MSPPDFPLIDAYLHVGRPRFGGPGQMLSFMDRFGIDRAVAVHGPRLIDGDAFTAIERAAPGRCRFVSVPPPANMSGKAREAHIAAMLDFGAIGFRLQAEEYRDPALLDAVGARDGIVFAIDPLVQPDYVAILTEWLARWPKAAVVLPHCIKLDLSQFNEQATSELVAHPRVHPIISRQTGASSEAFPHRDLWQWVERLVELGAGPRLMWASEYPVFFTRAEPLTSVRDWFLETGLLSDETELRGFFGGRAVRLFFDRFGAARPDTEAPSLPPPLDPVPLKDFHLASDVHGSLIDAFVDEAAYLRSSYHEYVNARLRGAGEGAE